MLLYTVLLFIGLFLLLRFTRLGKINGLSPWVMPLAFSAKMIVGLYFLFIYTESSGKGSLSLDAGVFMQESKMLNDVFYDSPNAYLKFLVGLDDKKLVDEFIPETTHWDVGAQSLINDNKNVLRLHSIIHFISFNSAIVHTMILCFIGVFGMRHLFYAIRARSHINSTYLFWGLMAIPSLLFWTSSVLKEPMMLLGFALLIRSILHPESTRKNLLYGILGSLILIGFKPYVFFAFVPALLFLFLYNWLPKFKAIGSLLILASIGAIVFVSFPQQREKAIKTISRKQLDFKNVGRGGIHAYADTCFIYFSSDQIPYLTVDGDSVSVKKNVTASILKLGQIDDPIPIQLEASDQKWLIYFQNVQCRGFIEISSINDSYLQLIKNIPEALVNTFFRPFLNDPGSWLKYPATIEVWIILSFLVYAIFKRRKLNTEERGMLITLILFSIVLALIIGWVTPVLGAIARYRIPIYTVLVMIGFILLTTSKKQKHG